MSKLGAVAIGAALVGAGWLGAMASGCSTAFATSYEEVRPPEVIELACKSDGARGVIAQQAFPGRKAVDLARATALLHYAPSDAKNPDPAEYLSDTTKFSAKDGSILVLCEGRAGAAAESATLIVPAAM